MISLWSRQILAVLRLEMRKTFFARRGLWIYLLALAPVVLFAAHSIDVMQQRAQRQQRAAACSFSPERMAEIKPGMTREQVIAMLGQPAHRDMRRRRREAHEFLWYSDAQTDFIIHLTGGEVTGINRRESSNLSEDSLVFAGVFQFFYLRLAVFFGCLGVFMNLFRGELLDKSLHFYFLAPVRREVVLAGKFLAGLIATVLIFSLSTVLQLWALSWHFDSNSIQQYLWQGNGAHHVAAYIGVTALACIGYGSVLLAAGIFFRNPIVPAALVLIWESANWILPAALKKISIIFYLQSLSPIVAPAGYNVPPPLALLASTAAATPAYLAITGLLLMSLVVLTIAALKLRRLEINYSTD
ncbi:MAG TPA: outer membrane protein assembly factor BamE [Bryobacteraceae bacterium]|nr:outer membrane protein assembly factor BamE [Bryobacteraceae bacterium]